MLVDFFFFNDTATTEIYTLSLHDALPICQRPRRRDQSPGERSRPHTSAGRRPPVRRGDRKSTRLNSSHSQISYAVFCLKKKTQNKRAHTSATSLLTLCTGTISRASALARP